MSRGRIIVAGVVVAVLGSLMTWQVMRERKVAACISIGGVWKGAMSECVSPRPVILERERLKRG